MRFYGKVDVNKSYFFRTVRRSQPSAALQPEGPDRSKSESPCPTSGWPRPSPPRPPQLPTRPSSSRSEPPKPPPNPPARRASRCSPKKSRPLNPSSTLPIPIPTTCSRRMRKKLSSRRICSRRTTVFSEPGNRR